MEVKDAGRLECLKVERLGKGNGEKQKRESRSLTPFGMTVGRGEKRFFKQLIYLNVAQRVAD